MEVARRAITSGRRGRTLISEAKADASVGVGVDARHAVAWPMAASASKIGSAKSGEAAAGTTHGRVLPGSSDVAAVERNPFS
jgi:hypothetical protein